MYTFSLNNIYVFFSLEKKNYEVDIEILVNMDTKILYLKLAMKYFKEWKNCMSPRY